MARGFCGQLTINQQNILGNCFSLSFSKAVINSQPARGMRTMYNLFDPTICSLNTILTVRYTGIFQ